MTAQEEAPVVFMGTGLIGIRICGLLDKLENMYGIRSALSDHTGWHMLSWVIDNPLPKDWDSFLLWVEAHDMERDMLSYDETD